MNVGTRIMPTNSDKISKSLSFYTEKILNSFLKLFDGKYRQFKLSESLRNKHAKSLYRSYKKNLKK